MPASLAALRISGQGQKTDLGLMLINPVSRINKRFDREVWAKKPGISPAHVSRAIANNEKSPIHPSSCLDLLE
ncbi:hypothetical protein [Microcoleus vaginatus]|uniref:hypothetical protein n=1 Tax=Microcoleus vaginatus TaxID=119532 RepID=UPI00168422C0|nr:hypothetical protein [Microcoleus sp. FACHB-DQ6]MBD1886389.1 hypothetical protein [Microcoleus sp. FACHB-84]MBD2010191.1 hypothetical protein [Microcoleus sp. FACHB-45]